MRLAITALAVAALVLAGCSDPVGGSPVIAVNHLTTLSARSSEVHAQHRKSPRFSKHFEPVVVAGYPALCAGEVDDRKRGMRELDVGVTDTLCLQVLVNHIPRGREVCEPAARG